MKITKVDLENLTDLLPKVRSENLTYQLHGSIQIRLIHASSREHSSSRTHPGGFSIGIGTQERSVSGTHPVRHEQIMVRNGTVSTTEQTAVASQGFNSKQGLRHLASMQAKPDAQSASTTHSGSAITDSGGGLGVQSTNGSPTYPGRERYGRYRLLEMSNVYCG